MRTVSSLVLGLLSVVLVPAALVAAWVAAVLSDTDAYVDTVSPLSQDPAVQKVIEDTVVDAVVARVDAASVERVFAERIGLPNGVAPGTATELVGTWAGNLVRTVTHRIVTSDDFPDTWDEANRVAHEELVAVLSGDREGVVDADGRINIPLSAMVEVVVNRLAGVGVDVSALPETQASFAFIDTDDLTMARRVYAVTNSLGWWLTPVAAVAVLLTIVLARRRWRALGWLAAGSAATTGALLLLLEQVERLATRNLPAGTDPVLVEAVVTIVLRDLRSEVRVLAVVALGLAVLLLAGAVLGGARRDRSATA